jgi:CRISPR/Cas system type I-B associated protein Csh2 (Cas7 group RAMP superfamily)
LINSYLTKIDKLTKRKRENIQSNKIRNEKGDSTVNTEGTQRIIRSYFKSLHSTKLENLSEMEDFLDRFHLPKLNQDQVNNLNSPLRK